MAAAQLTDNSFPPRRLTAAASGSNPQCCSVARIDLSLRTMEDEGISLLLRCKLPRPSRKRSLSDGQ